MDASVFTTIMFSDVTGSTTLYEQLGDGQANRQIHFSVMVVLDTDKIT